MSNEDIKVSVILPVFNVEPYIEKCLNSLQSQTIKELEFIFVDDKSPDGSIAIVEEAAKEDVRIRILYNEENMGPGPSRNRGIEIARGEYINFMDPDDYVASNFYEILYNLAKQENLDAVKGHVTAVDVKDNKTDGWPDANEHYAIHSKKSEPLFLCNLWENFSNLYRRSFIMSDEKLRFPSIKAGEDSAFLTRANLKNPSFRICNDTEYYHLIRDNSLEGNISFDSCLEGIKSLEIRIDTFEEFSYPEHTASFLQGSVNYYIGRFRKADKGTEDSDLQVSQRKLFKEKLDAALSKLPKSMKITDGLKSYETLEDMITSCGDDILISVIIPVYNVKPYLVAALDSVGVALRGITSEVICVDDGSNDGSAEMLDEYASTHYGFCVLHKENGGVAAARNYGLEKAKGKYIAFVDPDDILPKNIYKDMLYICEANELNLCVCNATRFEGTNKGVVSPQYQHAFDIEPKHITTIEESMSFVYDGGSWNKLIRRDFWNENGFSFPEVEHYEDMPVWLKFFCTVDRFALIHSFGYHWRITPGGNSLSQQVKSLQTLKDRIEVCSDMLSFLQNKYGEDAPLTRYYIKKLLTWEFDNNFWRVDELDEETCLAFCEEVRDFYQKRIPEDALCDIPVIYQKRYKIIMDKDVDALIRLMNHRRIAWRSAPVVEMEGGHYLKLPEDIYGQEYADVSLELEKDMPLNRVVNLTQNEGKVVADIVVYHPRVNVPNPDSQKVKAFLYNEHTGQRIDLQSEPFKIESWTKSYGKQVCQDDYRVYHYNYDWAGVRVTFDFNEIIKEDEGSRGILEEQEGIAPRWMICMEYKTPVREGYRLVRGIVPKVKKIVPDFSVDLEYADKKYKYDFMHDMRETLYIEVNKLI